MKPVTYYQQGDVLIKTINSLPEGLVVNPEGLIVQHGEHTNHSHRLDSGTVYINPQTKIKYLTLVQDTTISHEEHKPIRLPRGTYEIGIVREYDHFSEEARAVVD